MNIKKTADAYAYLEMKCLPDFDDAALKILWLADFNSLRKYLRTVTGNEFPITELPTRRTMKLRKCKSCHLTHRAGADKYGPFGQLSCSDMMSLDQAFLDYAASIRTSDETDDLHVRKFESLEEVFEGISWADEAVADIRENQAMRRHMVESGLIKDDEDFL